MHFFFNRTGLYYTPFTPNSNARDYRAACIPALQADVFIRGPAPKHHPHGTKALSLNNGDTMRVTTVSNLVCACPSTANSK